MIRRRHLGPVAALVTLAVLGGSGAAVATWTASASTAATASSATVRASLSQTGLSNTTPQQYKGGTAPALLGSLALTNEGTAPLGFTLALAVTGDATLAAKTSLTLWTTGASTCTATPGADAVTTTLADPAPVLPASARQLAPKTSRLVCAATRIAGTDGSTTNAALQGKSLTATFTATGSVGSWTASAAASAFTQSVYRLATPAGAVGCRESSRSADLTWSAPANRPAGRSVGYQVVDTATGATVKTIASANPSVALTLEPRDFARNGTYTLAVVASEADFGTTSEPSATFTITRTSPLGWDLLFHRLECSA